MKRPFLVLFLLLFVAGIVLVVAQLFLPGPRVGVSPQTTWLTSPLAADGLPDYAAWLLEQGSEGVTSENNGAVPYLQAMWPAGIEPGHQGALLSHLGMTKPANGMRDPSDDKAFKETMLAWIETLYPVEEDEREGEEDLFANFGGEYEPGMTLEDRMWNLMGHAESNPWKRSELPLLAQWIDDHAEYYDLLHEAAARPKFYLPPAELIVEPQKELLSVLLPTIQTQRAAARCLEMRALLQLGEGDAAAAWKDCQAMYKLANWNSHSCFVSELVSIAIAGVADALLLEILNSESLTVEVAEEILAFHQSRQPRNSMVDALDTGERLMFVTTILALAGERGDGTVTLDALSGGNGDMAPLGAVAVDWNLVLEKGNTWYDRLVKASRNANWEARHAAQQQVVTELEGVAGGWQSKVPAAIFSRSARSDAMGDMLLGWFLPALQAVTRAEDRSNALHQLHTVAAALAVHRLRQGSYPEKLDELVPGLLQTLPIDLYGRPLVYRRTELGYLLYSLGENGADEGGSSEQMSTYEGYIVDEDNEAAVRDLLGLPPLKERDADLFGKFEGEELEDKANFPLGEQIPAGSDDWSLRLPLPEVRLPDLSPPPEGEGAGDRDEGGRGEGPEN